MKKLSALVLILLTFFPLNSYSATAPERIIGYRDGNPALWFPYSRDAENWSLGLDNSRFANFGWTGITSVHLADLNGDGLDDKVMTQNSGNTHQFIVNYTTTAGIFTGTSFDILQTEWWNNAVQKPIFGDIDGDGIDDNGITSSGADIHPGYGVDDELIWGCWLSGGETGLSGATDVHSGWNSFGVYSTDTAIMGDFNADGIDDRAVYRLNATTYEVYIDFSNPAGGYGDSVADVAISLGQPGDTISVSDINADGIDDLVVIRPNTTGNYYDLYGYYTGVGGVFDTSSADVVSLAGVVSLNDKILFGQIDPILQGDTDLDGDVDYDDLVKLALNWLSVGCSPSNSYCNYTDVNRDSEVNLEDYASLSLNWQVGVPNTYYISSSTGSDSNSGLSENEPWQTFNNITRMTMQPGERILLKRGDTWTQMLRLMGNGTADKKIEVSAYGTGVRPIISRINNTTDHCVQVRDGSHWKINNLDLRNAKLGIYLRYMNTYDNEDVTISDCHFEGMDDIDHTPENYNYELAWSCAIWVGGQINAFDNVALNSTVLSDLTVRNCTFVDCITGVSNNWYYLPTPGFRSRLTNFLIEDCQQWGLSLNGIVALNHASNGLVQRVRVLNGGGDDAPAGITAGFLQHSENLTIDDCEFSYFDRINSPDGTGFDFEGDCHDIMFTNNLIHNNDGAAILWMSSIAPNTNVTMKDCVFFNNALDAYSDPGDNDYELKSAGGQDGTGTVENCGIYRSSVSSDWFSSKWTNVAKINNRLGYYSDVAGRPTAWEFNTYMDLEGWDGFNQWTSNTVSDGVLWGSASGNDPYGYSSETWVNTHDYRYLIIRMKNNLGTSGQVFFTRETDSVWNEDKMLTFNTTPDGQFHEYVIDMKTSSKYKGMLTKIRLDPTDVAGDTFAIDYVRFSSTPF